MDGTRNGAGNEQWDQDSLAAVAVGDVLGGTVTAVRAYRDASVALDGCAGPPLGEIVSQDLSWRRSAEAVLRVGQRITAEVVSVDRENARIRLSTAATENPELWRFLKGRCPGELVSGTIASIESFGVFVALDEGPGHPVFPGVGFVSHSGLSWCTVRHATEIVSVGERVRCEFLAFDTWNGEARLSLRATRPDPFQSFADRTEVGRQVRGRIVKLAPIGAFAEITVGVVGLIPLRELPEAPVTDPEDLVRVGDEVTAVVTTLERERRRFTLSMRQVSGGR
ncbi:S1 RNA-binding domain-containing protein [Nocardiopsis sp. YSL2]|uniref:S1 RNA-binding domain-containing protein n=1 Tax=Nocardiopsis sp. YSL2 TaxID=2939492 RepID=UPI0026F4432D|nr:S1 RNA-binding domain-containing protein [Nocardiopsis sp. YSL2]